MSQLCKFNGPGYFYVLSQPKSHFLDEYHEWYNSEHGPLRLKLDFFLNGYRYKSTDPADPPIWLACYDLKKISSLDEPRYTVLREKRSEREQELLNHKLNFLDRRIYSDVSSRGRNGGPAPVVMTVAFLVANELVDEMNRWYEEEHIDDLSKIPGWRRSRRFQLIEGDNQKKGYTELLAVHDFEKENGIDGPEHEFAKSRPWRNRILGLVERRDNKRFEFYHEFEAEDYRKPAVTLVTGDKTSTSGTALLRN